MAIPGRGAKLNSPQGPAPNTLAFLLHPYTQDVLRLPHAQDAADHRVGVVELVADERDEEGFVEERSDGVDQTKCEFTAATSEHMYGCRVKKSEREGEREKATRNSRSVGSFIGEKRTYSRISSHTPGRPIRPKKTSRSVTAGSSCGGVKWEYRWRKDSI